MIAFFNGQFVPEQRARISIFDRGFLYGDGLFETLRVSNGEPFLWDRHWARLESGARALGIVMPFSSAEILGPARQLVILNRLPESVLRLALSRGVGPRGYSPRGADKPTFVMSVHSLPEFPESGWRLAVVPTPLSSHPLGALKTCNKLSQILARAQAEAAGADEALLLHGNGSVAETSSGNLFWVQNSRVHTPPVSDGLLPGITRQVVLEELCPRLSIPVVESSGDPGVLHRAEGLFVTLSTLGIVPVCSVDGHPVSQSPVVVKLINAYTDLLREKPSKINS